MKMDVEKQAEREREIEQELQDWILQSDTFSGDMARLHQSGKRFSDALKDLTEPPAVRRMLDWIKSWLQ